MTNPEKAESLEKEKQMLEDRLAILRHRAMDARPGTQQEIERLTEEAQTRIDMLAAEIATLRGEHT